MKKLFLILIFFILTVLSFLIYKQYNVKETIQSIQLNKEVIEKPTIYSKFELPKKIVIPKINVKAEIESVGKDAKGNMDIPKLSENVAWYNLGFKPGEKGNAVLAGHFDTASGQPAVFWNLNKLSPGDEIIIYDNKDNSLRFEVTHKKSYKYNNFPIKEVFGDNPIERLNLITCGGQWNSSSQIYTERIVVFTRKTNK